MRHISFIPRLALLGLAAFGTIATLPAHGQTINFTSFAVYSPWNGASVDPTSGKFYRRNSYDATTSVFVYNNAADFVSNTVATTLTLNTTLLNTYINANGGKIYGNSGINPQVSRWNGLTGASEVAVTVSNMNSGGFNWGGNSFTNMLQDSTGMYVYGRDNTNNAWRIHKLDTNLSVVSTVGTSITGTQGYAFMVNGNLFSGNSYNSNIVSNKINFASGTVSPVNFTLNLPFGGGNYIDDFFYDPTTDNLYAHDQNAGRYYVTSNAAQQLGVSAVPSTPEPGAAALFASLGLGGGACLRLLRRRRSRKA